jgi:hypothetical protein
VVGGGVNVVGMVWVDLLPSEMVVVCASSGTASHPADTARRIRT